MKNKFKNLFLVMIPLFLKAVSVFAQIPNRPPETVVSRRGIMGLIEIINNARNTIYVVTILIGVLFILLSGAKFITSSGNEKEIEKAKKMFKNTIIGLIIALLCVSIVLVTISLLDVSSGNENPSGGNLE
jgi:hypothetical protein